MLLAHRKILAAQRDAIVQDLLVEDVFDELRGNFVLTQEDTEQILSEKTSGQQAKKLLKILPDRGNIAFECFRKSLREKYPHLAQLLTETSTSSQGVSELSEGPGPMTQNHRRLLTAKRVDLVDDLLVDDVLPYLIGKFVFHFDDCQLIRAEKTDKLRAGKLLDLLLRKGEHAFGHFVDALKDTYPCLAELLVVGNEESPGKMSAAPSVETELASFHEGNSADISDLSDTNVHESEHSMLKSCLPEKLLTFIGRDTEVKTISSFLLEKDCGIVTIVGGPGFGKSTIAVEVAHRISEQHRIPVIFSHLSNTSTIAEVAQRLCLDIGVYPGKDPKSSLIFWLRNMEGRVVLVMDNIEKLLEGGTRSEFLDLVRLLRKNSGQQLQIITTSRTKLSIADLTNENVDVGEMDDDSSVELLRKSCPNAKLEEDYLLKLASLCGRVPLALCIAASRLQDVDDPNELLTWLTEKPMETLQTSDPSHRVRGAINMSFEMLSEEDKREFVRLSVFSGNFDRNSAQAIINRDSLGTQDFLKNLVDRSLIHRRDGRFSIHPLVRRFLTDHDQLRDERAQARELMVEHFLTLCQRLTVNYYSKGGFNKARELLKKDAHNVEETLKECGGGVTNLTPNVIKSLANSDIYQFSSRFFYYVIRNILPTTVIRNFLESCVELAKRRENVAIEINFHCLLAEQEGHKSGWHKSREYMSKMEEIKELFDRNREEVEGDNALLSHFYYSYGRYLSNKKSTPSCSDPLEEATNYLQCLNFGERKKAQSPLENADQVMTLIQLGRISKKRATREQSSADKEKYERYMSCAHDYYKGALMLVEQHLADHELKSSCYKLLGDLFLDWRKNEEALKYYDNAKSMHHKLRFDASEGIVYLLKNYGLCFFYLGRYGEAVQLLNEARDIADKLAEPHAHCRAQVYFSLAKILNHHKPACDDAVKYATVAIEMKEFFTKGNVTKMEEIIEKQSQENIE